jgi:hypothetical protein
MTGLLLAVVLAWAALAAVCGPWWARTVRARYWARQDRDRVLYIAEYLCRTNAGAHREEDPT